jgi:hypothetical protein
MEQLEGGECGLAGLAADLGFADRAHLPVAGRQRIVGRPSVINTHGSRVHVHLRRGLPHRTQGPSSTELSMHNR